MRASNDSTSISFLGCSPPLPKHLSKAARKPQISARTRSDRSASETVARRDGSIIRRQCCGASKKEWHQYSKERGEVGRTSTRFSSSRTKQESIDTNRYRCARFLPKRVLLKRGRICVAHEATALRDRHLTHASLLARVDRLFVRHGAETEYDSRERTALRLRQKKTRFASAC